MPNYIYIQCFLKYEEKTFNFLLNSFRLALYDLGFTEDYLKNHVDKVVWEIADTDFMYKGCHMPSENIEFTENHFAIKPKIMGFTPNGFEGLKDNWIEFALLFEDDKVTKNYGTGEMYDSAKKPIWTVCNILSKHFPNTLVILTDGVADGFTWEATLGLFKDIYCFALAIVPNCYLELFNSIPDGFEGIELNSKTYIARLSAWGYEPWIQYL